MEFASFQSAHKKKILKKKTADFPIVIRSESWTPSLAREFLIIFFLNKGSDSGQQKGPNEKLLSVL